MIDLRKLDWPARILFAAALLFTLFMALNPSPPATPLDHYGDKTEHMLAFGTLTVLARFGFPRMPRWQIAERMSFLGALIEVFQAMPLVHRDCDWHDWVADTIAAVLAVLIADWLLRRIVQSGFAEPAEV